MEFNRLLTAGLLAGSLLLAPLASAKDVGTYIGASVGLASFEEKESVSGFGSISFDEDDFAYKIFAGYQFSGLFAIEGGYVDFGAPSDDVFEIDAYGLDLFGVVGLPIGPIRAFGKLGGVYWDADVEVFDTFSASDDGFEFAAGAGLELEILGLGVRAEVEYFDIADAVWMYTVGATFTF